jgi:seryl-tRNA(Sec) selenium transferase
VETRRGEAHQEGEGFYDELIVLEELQTKAVLRLMKAKLLIETVVAAEHFKRNITSDEIKKYLNRKNEAIQNQFKKVHVTLIDEKICTLQREKPDSKRLKNPPWT